MFVEDDKVKALARIVHETNRAFCESIGDMSQKPWSEAAGYNHQSAMSTVRAICDCPSLTPEDCHDIWANTKKSDGWVYGKTKDWDKKTHPSLVPYDKLSAVEKYKDWLVIYATKSYVDYIRGDAIQAEESDVKITASHITALSKMAYEANRAFCSSIGGEDQQPWEQAPRSTRISIITGVKEMLYNPSLTPEQSHQSWMAAKVDEGWTYGENKDVDAKTHPCLLPYDQLSAADKFKDQLFKYIVISYINYMKEES